MVNPSPLLIDRAKQSMVGSISQGIMEPCMNIVQSGFPVDDPIIDCGITILMHVAATCDAQQLRQILTLRPQVNARDDIGRTALHFACRAGKEENFDVLMESEDIDFDAVTNAGVTPLMTAVESGDIQLVAKCLNERLNPFLKDALDRTAFDYAQHFRDVLGHDMRQLI